MDDALYEEIDNGHVKERTTRNLLIRFKELEGLCSEVVKGRILHS